MNEKTSAAIRWDDLAAFLAVANAGGLSAAARSSGSSAPTLGRRMHALERALGRDLFLRRTHGYDLTDAGRDLLRDIEGVAARIERATARPPMDALPLVKLSAGTWTTKHLIRNIQHLAGAPPDTRFRFLAVEHVLSINRREAVIGLRNQRPTGVGLAAVKLGRVDFAAYAVPGVTGGWIRVNVNTPSSRWVTGQHSGEIEHEVDQPHVALDMALMGLGKVVLPTFIGDFEAILERVGGTIDDLAHDQWLVTHDDDRALPEVRRVIDRLAALLGRTAFEVPQRKADKALGRRSS